MDVRHAMLVALSATPLTGCPSAWNCKPDRERFELDEPVSAEEIDEALGLADADDGDVCATLCRSLYQELRGWGAVDVRSCTLTLPESEDEDDAGNVSCSGTTEYFCKGRRPLGHQEPENVDGANALERTLVRMAYLEAASVVAFEQLAERLRRWGAPAELIARCLCAAADERNHARWMTHLANQREVVVPTPRHASIQATLFDEALHNAVEGCVNETFAALVASHRAREVEDLTLRRLFTRIAVDETTHAQLAWDLHAWFRDHLAPTRATAIDDARAHALATLPTKAAQLAATEPGMSRTSMHTLATAFCSALATET